MTTITLIFLFCLHIIPKDINISSQPAREEIYISPADTCDDPDASTYCCFENMPANLSDNMIIAKENEAGERLVITGTVYKKDGKTPYPGVIMYAYHTDDKGYYSKKGNESGVQKWHGHLHGWCKTDNKGKYKIQSIRPAPYPNNSAPAHIHAVLKEPDGSTPYYISDFVFSDDPRVGKNYKSYTLVGGTGIVELKKENNLWNGKRDIILTK